MRACGRPPRSVMLAGGGSLGGRWLLSAIRRAGLRPDVNEAGGSMASPMRTMALPSGDEMPVLGQGTWRLAEVRARRNSEIAALRRGLDVGLNLIDTAEMYAGGDALAARRRLAHGTAGSCRTPRPPRGRGPPRPPGPPKPTPPPPRPARIPRPGNRPPGSGEPATRGNETRAGRSEYAPAERGGSMDQGQ